MGKRELLLVLGFLVVGGLIYQFTAPPATATDRSFSLTGLIEQARRHVRGNQASAELTTTAAYPVSSATSEVRLSFAAESLTVVGEERQDVASELHVVSNGFDDAEAATLAKTTVLEGLEAGGRIEFKVTYPGPGRQRANVTIRVPRRMRISVGRYSGKLEVSNTADVELPDSRGDVKLHDVSNRVVITHRGGDLTISDVGALKLTVRGADARISRVRGDATIQSQAGDLKVSEPGGAVDIEASGSEVRMEKLDTTTAPIRVNATNGSVRMGGVRSETRVDARNAEVILDIAQPAQVSAYTEGGEPLEVTLPPGGFDLDVTTTAGGRITAPEKIVEVSPAGAGQHASTRIHGGGPTITLRAAEGEIVLHAPGSSPIPEAPSPPARPRPTLPPTLKKLERR